jgi:hypothetical protein
LTQYQTLSNIERGGKKRATKKKSSRPAPLCVWGCSLIPSLLNNISSIIKEEEKQASNSELFASLLFFFLTRGSKEEQQLRFGAFLLHLLLLGCGLTILS